MATASWQILSTINGASEGGNDLLNLSWSNTAAVYTISQITLSTDGATGAQSFTVPAGARQVLVVPPIGNALPIRMANTTAAGNGALVSTGADPTLLSVSPALSTVVLWTTASTAVTGVRVIII